MDAQERIIEQRKAKHKKTAFIIKCIIALIVLCIVVLAVILIKAGFIDGQVDETIRNTKSTLTGKSADHVAVSGEAVTEGSSETEGAPDHTQAALASAKLLAQQYDYDGAIALLEAESDFNTNTQFQNAVGSYREKKQNLKAYPAGQVTHIFFHSLIVDTSLAFDADEDADGYNQYMVTIREFNSIIQQMYDKGYVMISPHDMCTVNEDGTVTAKDIYLPDGKIPFVLSQDDVSYYHYMDGDGFAQKLIVDENGEIKNTYAEADGTVRTDDYDLVPLVDDFVREHPDFSYHGHKGVIALTGYEGVLGYRTDEVYKTREAGRVTEYQQKFFDNNPDFDFDSEAAQAKQVADAMKAEGWEFASHTWGHIDPVNAGYDKVVTDTERYKTWMEPIIGPTDILIFAFGADIGDWQNYSSDNQLFTYYKSQGFNIFCNVDSSRTNWVQFGDNYMRQARRNIDGYSMSHRADSLSDLFNVSEAWDSSRPQVPDL